MWDRFIQSVNRLKGKPVHRPLVWCALAAAAGTWLGLSMPGRFFYIWLAAGIILLAAIALARPRGRALTMAVAIAAALLFTARSSAVNSVSLPPSGEYTVEGVVMQAPRVDKNGQHVSVQLRDVTLTGSDGQTRHAEGLYWTAYVDEEWILPEPGSIVRLAGRLYHADGRRNPYGFDFSLYLKQNHMTAGFYNSGEYETAADAPLSFLAAAVRLRYALLSRLDEAFGERSALPKALLLGERDAMSDEDRAAFARVGIAHVLAVSGLHISLIVAALSLIVRHFMSGKKQLWLFGAFLLLYALLLDFRASVVRAAILTFTYLFVRSRGRNGDPLSALSLAFMIILMLSPVELMSAGFQLSFAAALGIVLLNRPVRRVTDRLLGRKAGGVFASTVSAIAGTALPSIQTFHSFSLAGFVFSPIVCVLLACLLPLCLVTLVLSLVWMDAARILAFPVGCILQWMTDGVSAAAQWPYMSVNCPSIPWPFYPLIIAAILLFSGYVPMRMRGMRRLAVLAALFAVGSVLHLAMLDNGVSYLQLDVGSADCAVIQDGRHTTVIDCGEDGRDLCDYLLAKGRRVNTLVLTHLHADHCLGAQDLIDNRIPIDRLVLPEGAERMAVSEEALELFGKLREYCGEVTVVSAGDTWNTERTVAAVLWPEKNGIRSGKDANDYCLCLEYRLSDTVMLLMADLPGVYEPYVRARADILKVAHHGSRSSTTESFVAYAAPETAIISVSHNADAADPEGIVQTRLAASGAEVCTTADCGAIRIQPVDGGYRVIRFTKEGAP